ncbi:SirB2 family protein [Glaciecola sp. XM2]|uniref:SirB2 family protein n=1 Tax=Glaciecola sp. XM2 TaxID=1914931 RepID=UPI001BDE2EF9|nr:SirB2 family protein [Glaciecola sp. XM2]MBT1451327.1 SirB2 family protein [Glaciecola sp. XM2]
MSSFIAYTLIKHVHITLALASVTLFCVRFYMSLNYSANLTKTWARVLPHCIDTLLLSLGIYLMVTMKLWPSEQPWLLVKLCALVVYIVLGSVAIKYGKTVKVKKVAGAFALLTYGYMVNVALSHQPLVIL